MSEFVKNRDLGAAVLSEFDCDPSKLSAEIVRLREAHFKILAEIEGAAVHPADLDFIDRLRKIPAEVITSQERTK